MNRRRIFLTHRGQPVTAEVEPLDANRVRVHLPGDEPLVVERLAGGTFSVAGRVYRLSVAADGSLLAEPGRERIHVHARAPRASERASSAGAGVLTAPMPGRVVKVLVAEGAEVTAGTPVLVVEAMKMENELAAPRTGVVRRLYVSAGAAVERDAPLLEIA